MRELPPRHAPLKLSASRPIKPLLDYNPPQAPLDIIYGDDDILVLNKPEGLLTVEGKHEDHKDCLEARAVADFPTARIVHRLDMHTSGLIVLALHAGALRHLSRQFELRRTEKSYEALVWGTMIYNEGIIDYPLRCDWDKRPLQMVDWEQGKPCETYYKLIDWKDGVSRVLLCPKTGRSHQLRVHMLALGHPILGDEFYADGEALAASPRLCLHAKKLTVEHPITGAMMTFESAVEF
ncbi:pseudouridine synthase [Lentilitoribacter sp. Alg239-R112]|uniref:pseudouridine synthase n=1 Tax=Lentilitoribacter sp. Alg239-R112 TaxID=2305987 RepID=UPI0013A6A77D|nr:pseudouridine synthase [Lentilitoribacter sp. Alg239-R112]